MRGPGFLGPRISSTPGSRRSPPDRWADGDAGRAELSVAGRQGPGDQKDDPQLASDGVSDNLPAMTPTVTGHDERRLLIGGEWVEASGSPYEVVNPASEQPIGLAPEASADDASAAAEAAREAFGAWSRTTPAERSALLLAAAELV